MVSSNDRAEWGSISLIGAGPGCPDMLTVGAARALANENALVIADRLVSPEVLSVVKGELRVARKLPGCQQAAQEELYKWAEEGVKSGRDVIRLKIGDPFVFGRGGEEVLHFRSALGIEAKVIPGVSAAFSSPLLGGIPVTHRGFANQVSMSTGYGKEDTTPNLQPYSPDQTAIFLMAVGRLGSLTERLQTDAGYPPTCPAAVVERASLPDQRVLIGTVADIAALAEAHAVQAPATVVFGAVVHALHADGAHGLVTHASGPPPPAP